VKAYFCLLVAILAVGCGAKAQNNAPKKMNTKSQEALISEHAQTLMEHGRLPSDFGSPFIILGQYGWVSDASGSRGRYSFYQPAFEQADRSWWIHGMMKAGSDLLIAVSRTARFTGGECNQWASSSNSDMQCVGWTYRPSQSPVGYDVGFMYKGPEHAKVLEVVDYKTLRLDKRAVNDVLQFDLSILPPDYVDMCSCMMPSTSSDSSDLKKSKPYTPGMTLGPGESTAITIQLPVKK